MLYELEEAPDVATALVEWIHFSDHGETLAWRPSYNDVGRFGAWPLNLIEVAGDCVATYESIARP